VTKDPLRDSPKEEETLVKAIDSARAQLHWNGTAGRLLGSING